MGENGEEGTVRVTKEPGTDVLGRGGTTGEIKQPSAGGADPLESFIRTTVGADDAG